MLYVPVYALIRAVRSSAFAAILLCPVFGTYAAPIDPLRVAAAELSATDRAAGLRLVEREVYNVFPIRERLVSFQRAISRRSQELFETETTAEYYAILESLVAELNDGHTFIQVPAGAAFRRSKPPLGLIWLDGQAVIGWTVNSLVDRVPLGSVALAVDGVDVMAVLQERERQISASTTARRRQVAMWRALEGQAGTFMRLAYVTPEGERRVDRFERGAAWPDSWRFVSLEPVAPPRTDFREYDGGRIVYFAARDFQDDHIVEEFQHHLGAIQSSHALILDLRGNTGGKSAIGYQLLRPFMIKPLREGRSFIVNAESDGGGDTDRGRALVEIEAGVVLPAPTSQRATAQLIILTDHGTMSAAEDFLSLAEQIGAIRVGQTSAGSTGETKRVPLPGGGELRVLRKLDLAASGRPFVGSGFAPDIPATPTLSVLKAGRDAVLERALEVARKHARR